MNNKKANAQRVRRGETTPANSAADIVAVAKVARKQRATGGPVTRGHKSVGIALAPIGKRRGVYELPRTASVVPPALNPDSISLLTLSGESSYPELGYRDMTSQSWKWAVEIEQLGGTPYVRIIEDGNVRVRAFDRMSDAEQFAESERVRLKLPAIVYR